MKNAFLSILFLLLAGGAFFGGMTYQKKLAPKSEVQQNVQRGPASLVNGTVKSKTGNSVTITLQQGGEKTVVVTDKTTVREISQVAAERIEVGKNITANVVASEDGTLNASFVNVTSIAPRQP